MLRRLLATWLVLAIVVAFTAPFGRAPIGVPITVVALVSAGVVAYRRGGLLRDALDRVDLRLVILVHVVRAAIGAAFLVELGNGNLPERFAVTAGYGDIAAGTSAIVVAYLARRRALVYVWNALAFADIVIVIATANSLSIVHHDETMLAAFARVPYALLPLFFVPIVILTHALVLTRLRGAIHRGDRRPPAPAASPHA